MPRLVLINGAPSSGKSTLANRYVEDHPLTLALDIDVVRAMLGRWLDEPAEAGQPRTRAIITVDGQVEQAYRDLLTQLAAQAAQRPSLPVDGD